MSDKILPSDIERLGNIYWKTEKGVKLSLRDARHNILGNDFSFAVYLHQNNIKSGDPAKWILDYIRRDAPIDELLALPDKLLSLERRFGNKEEITKAETIEIFETIRHCANPDDLHGAWVIETIDRLSEVLHLDVPQRSLHH